MRSFFLVFFLVGSLLCDESCMDYMISCSDLRSQCSEPFIQEQCQYTCGICRQDPSQCSDTFTDCPYYETMCNFDVYQKKCPKTCNHCFAPEDCVDHLQECPMYSRPCSVPVSRNCPVSCGVCTPLTTFARTTIALTTPKPTTTETSKPTTTITPTTRLPIKTTTTRKIPVTPKPPCKDASPNCGAWAKNGFCTNTFYPPEKRKEFCAKTCKMC